MTVAGVSNTRSGKEAGSHLRAQPPGTFTPRQQAVLSAGLDVLIEHGDRLTMTAVARQARCSKETLYKWFGDREGLLTAIVQWQASKVRVPALTGGRLDAASLRAGLLQVARDLLATITSDVSVALNRLAVSHAAGASSGLGSIMLEHGPSAIRRRVTPLLEAGRKARLLEFTDSEAAYRAFFGLVVRDAQIRLLLGERLKSSDIEQEASAATEQFFGLHGAALVVPRPRGSTGSP